MEIKELIPTNGQKSFYGKAKVLIENGEKTLVSYSTKIIKVSKEGKLIPLANEESLSKTTLTHLKSFCDLNKKEYLNLLKKS